MMADLARIKRNVAKMASMKAPEADIDGYIASEGVTVDDVRNFKMSAPASQPAPVAQPADPNDNYVSQGLSGFNEGLAKGLGAPVDLVTAGLNAGVDGINALTHGTIPHIQYPVGGTEMFTDLLSPTIAKPSADTGKQMVRRVAEELGAAAIPMGGVASKAAAPIKSLASQALATAGAGAGAAVAQQVAPGNPVAELAGEIVGGLSVGGAAGLARKAITPNPMSAERAAAVETLKKEGVDLTAGQATGSKNLKYAESELGGGKVSDIIDNQGKQFTRAILKRAGINADLATPEVLDDAFNGLGQQFDGLAARNRLVPDPSLSKDLSNAVKDYNSLVPESQRAPIVNNVLGDLVAAVKRQGYVDGAAYQALRSRLDKAGRASRITDPQLSGALFDIRNALDANMERSIARTNPNDLGAWHQARKDYANLLVIEKAAAGGGDKAGLGIITPAQLKQAAANQNHRNFTRGKSDFTKLAKAGQATMTPMPESGTSYRLAARGVANLPAAIGGAVGGTVANVPGAIAGAAAGHYLPSLVGKVLLSNGGRAYLGNQALVRPLLDPTAAAGPAAAIAVNQASEPVRIRINGGR